MKRRKCMAVLLLSAAVTMSLASCSGSSQESRESADTTSAAEVAEETQSVTSGLYTAGTYSGSSAGHNGLVEVTVEVSADAIESITMDVSGETPEYGQAAEEVLKEQILAAQGVEIDGVSGATDTTSAVRAALAEALSQARGEEIVTTMAAGTYEGSDYGFYPGKEVTVRVTVNENRIDSIEIDDDNMESPLMLRAVKEKLVPRILEYQSIGVDSITGATRTSSAVKSAVSQCLEEAMIASSGSSDGLAKYMEPVSYEETDAISLETDTLVVGLGGSGITAALSAAENGGKVLAIDKAGKYGGTTCVTGEMLAVNPERFCEENNGGEDYVDAEALLDDWVTLTHGDAKQEMIELLLAESGNTLDWMMYDHEWPFREPSVGHTDYATYLVNYGYMPNNTYGNKAEIAGYIDKLMEDYVDAGGEYMLEVEAYELIYDAGTNTVTGVKAVRYDGQEYEITAKAVVLATGGYAANKLLMDTYMTDEYYPLSGIWNIYGMQTNDGKMLENALDIGAGTYNPSVPPISHLAGFPVNLTGFENYEKEGEISFFTGKTPIWSEGDIPTTLSVAADALAVTMDGERFFNEELFVAHKSLLAGPTYYTIWSTDQFKTFKTDGLDYEDAGPSMGYLGRQSTIPAGVTLTEIDDVIQAGIDAGYIYKADSVSGLAELLGMDETVLQNTVDTYNSYCESGTDEDYGKDPKYLDKVDGDYYYAILGCSFIYTTSGGLDVNSDFQVLLADGETPIEGLYAVGTDSMGVILSEQEQYVDYGGAAAGYAFTSGRLVGKMLAEKFGE